MVYFDEFGAVFLKTWETIRISVSHSKFCVTRPRPHPVIYVHARLESSALKNPRLINFGV